jgi:hypothetical protein
MKQVALPALQDVYTAMENASIDLYGFAMVCHNGVSFSAEPAILDVMLLGLENHWFTENEKNRLSHEEFRLEFFRSHWVKCMGMNPQGKIGTELPLGHEDMAFYKMPQISRAIIYLRTKKKFSYGWISMILGGLPEGIIEEEVERAREFLLGRRVKVPEWSEEEF